MSGFLIQCCYLNTTMKKYSILFLLVLLLSCAENNSLKRIVETPKPKITTTSLVVLGTIQDAGSPQIACAKSCCAYLFDNPDPNRQIISLGLIDIETNKTYLLEATPDIGGQMKRLTSFGKSANKHVVDGIFITHAHIGHYTGVMFLGKEAMDAWEMPVYVMPKMKNFLTVNSPWDQLVTRNNIVLKELANEMPVQLSQTLQVTPILVPHRDEFSETVGYKIRGPNKTALFIPDIDKWEKWDKNIIDEIAKVDVAFLDATFYSGKEINNRNLSEIPHPFIIESLEKFKDLPGQEKNKINFIHFNHTNPVLQPNSPEGRLVLKQGFNIAKINDVFEL